MTGRKKTASEKVDKALDAFEGLLAAGFGVSSSIRQNREIAVQAVQTFNEALGELFTKDEVDAPPNEDLAEASDRR